MWRSPCFTQTFSAWFYSHFKLNFVKPTLFSFGYDYLNAPACMVASQLNHQIILLLKCPLTHYWISLLVIMCHQTFVQLQCQTFSIASKKVKSQCSTLNVYHDFWGNNFHVLKCQMCCRHLPYWHFIVKYLSKLDTCTCTDPYWPSCRPICKILH